MVEVGVYVWLWGRNHVKVVRVKIVLLQRARDRSRKAGF